VGLLGEPVFLLFFFLFFFWWVVGLGRWRCRVRGETRSRGLANIDTNSIIWSALEGQEDMKSVEKLVRAHYVRFSFEV